MTKSFTVRLKAAAIVPLSALCAAGLPEKIARAQAEPNWLLPLNGLMVGFHYGVPAKWSVGLAAPLPGEFNSWKPFIAAEPGFGAWRASVGALKFTNDLGTGYVVRGSLLRTTSKAWRAPSQSTYVGPELQFMPLFAIGARVGGFLHVAPKDRVGDY